MATRLPAADWSATGLGPISRWSAPLRTAFSLALAEPTPAVLFWGPELAVVYNEPARPFLNRPDRLGAAAWSLQLTCWERLEPRLVECLRSGRPLQAEAEGDWRLSPVFDDEAPGGVGGVLAFIDAPPAAATDADRRLSESEARFRSVFNAEPLGMSVLDANTGQTLAINDGFLRMTGHDRADVEAGRWERNALIPPEQAALEEHAMAEARERGWWSPYETLIRRRDGSTFPARISSAPLSEAPGRVLVAIQDITTERAAQAALVASEERLRLGLEAGRMVTWEFDLRTGALTRSANSEAIFGWGSHPEDYTARMPAEDIEADQVRLQRALAASDGLYCSEFRYNHPDGRQLHLQNWGKIMRDADGAPIRVHGVCMDITDRKRAENALKHLNETLEQEVQKRTDELVAAEKALRQSQKMEALGHLTGGVAHDFNNLLGAMAGSFDLIRRKADDPDRVRSLAEAGLKVAERGAKLTSQLLTFSRGQPIELRPVRVAETLHGMHELLERTLGPQIALRLDLACNDGAALSDPTQLEMAVLNLAINSRDAMPVGGTLTISTRKLHLDRDPALPAGDYVELVVADTGTGMSADVAALAFDPFFTTKEVGKGTGLGLSQVYGIARQAGGTVRIDSAPGQGTRVHMLLPGAEPAAPSPWARPGPARPDAAQALEILLVDDDLDLREVLRASLEDLGYRVSEAENGAVAMDRLAQAAPDLLIADFAMPGMTGAELARAARARWPHLPIVFASGYADTDAIGAAAGSGTQVLRKPFRIDELQLAIDAALARRAA